MEEIHLIKPPGSSPPIDHLIYQINRAFLSISGQIKLLSNNGTSGVAAPTITAATPTVSPAPPPPPPPVPTRVYEDDLIGPKDGVNTTFTSNHTILFGTNGKPRALLTWRRARQFYTPGIPGPGRYTIILPLTVIMGEPPAAGDYLAWDTIDIS